MNESCRQAREQIERYLDGELSPRKRARLDHHLGQCASCRIQLETLRLHGELLRQEIAAAADAVDFSGFEEKVLARAAVEAPLPFRERATLWLREVLHHYRAVWVTSLATAVLLIAVLVPLLSRGPAVPGADSAAVDNEVIIDKMEYAGERSMIFTVSKNNTTVIWLYDMDQLDKTKTQGDDL